MEIREGIKFKDEYNRFCTITSVKFDNNVGHWIVDWEINNKSGFVRSYLENVLGNFEMNRYKIIEYPYKIGDWVVDINNQYITIREPILQIIEISNGQIWCNDDRSVGKSRQSIKEFNECYRPAFKEEIPNYKQKIVKENYNYLIPMLTELNTS